jgi:hypothetical protein
MRTGWLRLMRVSARASRSSRSQPTRSPRHVETPTLRALSGRRTERPRVSRRRAVASFRHRSGRPEPCSCQQRHPRRRRRFREARRGGRRSRDGGLKVKIKRAARHHPDGCVGVAPDRQHRVGRRGRQRAQLASQAAKTPRDRMARVQASDEVWAAYRASLGTMPVSVALGELVRREVGRNARRSASDTDGARLALEDARRLSDELASLIARLERATGPSPAPSVRRLPLSEPHWADDLY